MTNPIKALAEAARRCSIVLHNMAKERDGWHLFGRWEISDEPLRNDAMHFAPLLDDALAAYDAAQVPPSDAEIEAWRKSATTDPCKPPGANADAGYPIGYWLSAGEIDTAIRLMRRARPDDGLLRAARAVLTRNSASLPDAIDDLRAEVERLEAKP